eukprot:2409474-Pyramimonas_sp.AAC.1
MFSTEGLDLDPRTFAGGSGSSPTLRLASRPRSPRRSARQLGSSPLFERRPSRRPCGCKRSAGGAMALATVLGLVLLLSVAGQLPLDPRAMAAALLPLVQLMGLRKFERQPDAPQRSPSTPTEQRSRDFSKSTDPGLPYTFYGDIFMNTAEELAFDPQEYLDNLYKFTLKECCPTT